MSPGEDPVEAVSAAGAASFYFAGEAGLPRGTPSFHRRRLGGVWYSTLSDGRNESGLELHLVFFQRTALMRLTKRVPRAMNTTALENTTR